MDKKYADLKLGERAAILSIITYIILASVKLIIGNSTDSQALKADGWNNFTDIIASVAVLIGLRLSQKPADKDHPYGHWKAETVASLIASFIMMSVGLQVLYQAISSFFTHSRQAPDLVAAYTAIACGAVMFFVYRINLRLGKKINSQAVKAAAKDNFSDSIVSFGTAVGIFGAQLNLEFLDPLAACIVGLLICKTAWGIFRETTHYLTDGFDVLLIDKYKKTILHTDGVKAVKEIKARNYGNSPVVDVVITVNQKLDITDAHDISSAVENALINEFNVLEVHVHIEPDEEKQ
ncbi:cation transporter [Niallia circulans]|uniref:Transporter n=1 Tax=Niallia circulans TaxID=1397 RepID=A0A0J1ID09_NIACI|nr:cation diffusion facilitator family transporter [Niallia circulans]KLV23854.1 transporter [Niallia circulans]MDR4318523.1 cation transporter [Niallia circulans]MED4243461.1 cation diffusion facilitator family transporter [Niallia circulans]NRG34924.1 cation transporter [Niallia circulans]PAD25243.1 cation transporter [Niallia circulans]